MKKSKSPNQQKNKTSPILVGHGLLIFFGIVVLILLQNQYWNGEFGHHNLNKLQSELHRQERLNADQKSINAVLKADVNDLKSGLGAIEEHARLDLGLVKSGETFVQLSAAPVSYSTGDVSKNDTSEVVEPIDFAGLEDNDTPEVAQP